MALSNAERQARHRERVKAKLAAGDEPDDAAVEKLKGTIEKLKEQLAEKESARRFNDARAAQAEAQRDKAQTEAAFLRSDHGRLLDEVAALRNREGAREEGLQAAEDMLLDQYYGTGGTWLRFLNVNIDDLSYRDNTEVAAANRFAEEKIGFADIMLIVGLAAFNRLNQFYEEGAAGGGRKAGELEWRKHAKTISSRNA